MTMLDERLEIRLSKPTLGQLRDEAKVRGVSIAALVREAIDQHFDMDRRERLAAARDLFEIGAPVDDWPVMKREIEAGYVETGPSAEQSG